MMVIETLHSSVLLRERGEKTANNYAVCHGQKLDNIDEDSHSKTDNCNRVYHEMENRDRNQPREE